MKRLLALTLIGFLPLAQGANYTIDPDHTFVLFEVLHNETSTVRGRFDTIDGTLQFDREARTGEARLRIDMASINTGSQGFDAHLNNADFFDTDKHPEAQFRTHTFHFEGDQVRTIDGELELLGQAHPVTLHALRFNCYQNQRIGAEVCGGDFQTDIQRSQWGMTFGLPGIPDTVRLQIEVEAVRQ